MADAVRVVVAGAGGFVGRAVCDRLRGDGTHHVVGLSRRARAVEDVHGPDEWRACDLFSLRAVEAALEGADVAVYLVHSMMPTARLTQASFEDLDLILADNFGRAAKRAGVRRIIYLGGLIPHEGGLSPHLASRLEVERALAGQGVPVTACRAGLVIGAGGSSLEILLRLVERLPAMMLPVWTETKTHPIALGDAVELIAYCVRDEATAGRVCEIGGPDVLTYREMIQTTAVVLGRRRPVVGIPWLTPRLSRLWVRLITGVPGELVGPLVESLRHPMVATDQWLQLRANLPGQPWSEALRESIAGRTGPSSRAIPRQKIVRSVQRLPLPAGWDAHRVAFEYMKWLPRFSSPFVGVTIDGDDVRMYARAWPRCLLHLRHSPERSHADRTVFEVAGGSLLDPECTGARFEFRITPDGAAVLAAIHDFVPALPWWIYRSTQARIHLLTMHRFARHLAAVPRVPELVGASSPLP